MNNRDKDERIADLEAEVARLNTQIRDKIIPLLQQSTVALEENAKIIKSLQSESHPKQAEYITWEDLCRVVAQSQMANH